MFEKFLSANVESFRQRYEGTYGFYRDEKKKRLLVRLDSISPEECVFVNADGIDFRLRVDTSRDIGFEFLPPKSAWRNRESPRRNSPSECPVSVPSRRKPRSWEPGNVPLCRGEDGPGRVSLPAHPRNRGAGREDSCNSWASGTPILL